MNPTIASRVVNCNKCELRLGCKSPVPGMGEPQVVLISGDPGYQDDRTGRPIQGAAGKELDNYLDRYARIDRSSCYITFVVKCRPPKDRKPYAGEIDACVRYHLSKEVEFLRKCGPSPENIPIGLLGSLATETVFGPDFDLDTHHGFVYDAPEGSILEGFRVMPLYHPDDGLARTSTMIHLQKDFANLGDWVRNEIIHNPVDKYPNPQYRRLTDYQEVERVLGHHTVVAVDTEIANGTPWCMTFSVVPGEGYLIMADDKDCLAAVDRHLKLSDVQTVLHNALFDLGILRRMGIEPVHVEDTMVIAYLLQDQHKGLKQLAYRLGGIHMVEYMDMVRYSTEKKAYDYLLRAAEITWPDLDPEVILEENGNAKLSFPLSINARIQRTLDAVDRYNAAVEFLAEPQYEVIKRSGNVRAVHPLLKTALGSQKTVEALIEAARDRVSKGNNTSCWDRFHNWEEDEQILVESCLGQMHMGSLAEIPFEDALRYAVRDADATLRIFGPLRDNLEEMDLVAPYELDMRCLSVIDRMQTNGMKIDKYRLAKLSDILDESIKTNLDMIREFAGYPINPNSSQQLNQFLFGTLQLKPVFQKLTKAGELSTDSDTLMSLLPCHPVIQCIMDYKMASKLKTTYSSKLPLRADDNNRVHTSIKMCQTSTGRLSSAEPNLQNIPARTKEGKQVRHGFVADKGCKFIAGDYSQIEMRMVAHLSGDPLMKEIFDNDLDIHTRTASGIFGIPEDRVDELLHRKPAKTTGFGTLYGISAEGLLIQLISIGCKGWTIDKCQSMLDGWFSTFNGIREYFGEVEREARRYGYVRDWLGRIRRIPEVRSGNQFIIEAGERQACSMVVQGGAQEIIKLAMVNMIPIISKYSTHGICREIMQIHDEIIYEVQDDMVIDFMEDFKSVLNSTVELSVPLKSDIAIGDDWSELG